MKEQIIQIPDTLEIKEIKDGKIILIEKEKKLTYEDVARELFANKKAFCIATHGISEGSIIECFAKDSNNCTSRKQAEKLLAINMLINVAKYLNGDWQPDWKNRDEDKVFIYIDHNFDKSIKFGHYGVYQLCEIYFKSEELAKKAIEILGEETIRLALNTDY